MIKAESGKETNVIVNRRTAVFVARDPDRERTTVIVTRDHVRPWQNFHVSGILETSKGAVTCLKVANLSTVSFAAMPNPHNLYNFSSIFDFIDDAIVTYTNTPVIAGPCDFLASGRSWVLGKCF
jgi:hypothetical protein